MFEACFVVVGILLMTVRLVSFSSSTSTPPSPQAKKLTKAYLPVYLLAVTADWLQGPYVYSVYIQYGYRPPEIALLFVSGFLSSATLGAYIAGLGDRLGRKKMALMYCLCYSCACLTKLSPWFPVMLVGRVLSGVATSLLFSVFESWLVHEANVRQLSQNDLQGILGQAATGNGLVAICAGLMAQWAASNAGPVAPFMLAALVLALNATLIITTWTDNFGGKPTTTTAAAAGARKSSPPPSPSSSSTLKSSASSLSPWQQITSNPALLMLVTVQTAFEAGMYSFVFLWTPTLESAALSVGWNVEDLPLGLIFATFMECLMVGGSVFSAVVTALETSSSSIASRGLFAVLGFATVGFLVTLPFSNPLVLMIGFCVFELCCGMYFPLMGTARSILIPHESRSAVLSAARIPLNITVCAAFLLVMAGVPTNTMWAGVVALLTAGWIAASKLV